MGLQLRAACSPVLCYILPRSAFPGAPSACIPAGLQALFLFRETTWFPCASLGWRSSWKLLLDGVKAWWIHRPLWNGHRILRPLRHRPSGRRMFSHTMRSSAAGWLDKRVSAGSPTALLAALPP